jgi:hypothetical protein
MPSSRVEVETMTQSRASAKAPSERVRSSDGERGVGQEDGHLAGPERGSQFLDLAARVAEDKPFLSPVQGRDEFGRVVQGAHVVEFNFARGPADQVGGGLVGVPGPVGSGRQMHARSDDLPGTASCARALQPVQQVGGVADGRREPDPLNGPAGYPFQPFEHGEQMPSPVVAREGVHFVDDDGPHASQQVRAHPEALLPPAAPPRSATRGSRSLCPVS